MRRRARVKTSLGPDYTDMICFSCGNAGACGMVDRKGSPYVSCRYCRAMILSLHLRAVVSLRLLTDLLKDPEFKKEWTIACAEGEVAMWSVRDEAVAARAEAEKAEAQEEKQGQLAFPAPEVTGG